MFYIRQSILNFIDVFFSQSSKTALKCVSIKFKSGQIKNNRSVFVVSWNEKWEKITKNPNYLRALERKFYLKILKNRIGKKDVIRFLHLIHVYVIRLEI